MLYVHVGRLGTCYIYYNYYSMLAYDDDDDDERIEGICSTMFDTAQPYNYGLIFVYASGNEDERFRLVGFTDELSVRIRT